MLEVTEPVEADTALSQSHTASCDTPQALFNSAESGDSNKLSRQTHHSSKRSDRHRYRHRSA